MSGCARPSRQSPRRNGEAASRFRRLTPANFANFLTTRSRFNFDKWSMIRMLSQSRQRAQIDRQGKCLAHGPT